MYIRRIMHILTKFAYFGVFVHSFVHIRTLKSFGFSAYICRVILILTKFAYFGVSADVRRKTPHH